jgi:hypothetical protein
MDRNTVAQSVLAGLATARLTRLVTTDWLGEWWFRAPAKRWAWDAESPVTPNFSLSPMPSPPPENGWRSKLVSGLDCPFCVGFWIGVVVLLSLAIVRAVPPLLPLWKFVTGALALNYLTGHLSARIDE